MAPPIFLSTSEALVLCTPIPADRATSNRARHTPRTTCSGVNLVLTLNIGVPWYQCPLLHLLWSSIDLVQAEHPFSSTFPPTRALPPLPLHRRQLHQPLPTQSHPARLQGIQILTREWQDLVVLTFHCGYASRLTSEYN